MSLGFDQSAPRDRSAAGPRGWAVWGAAGLATAAGFAWLGSTGAAGLAAPACLLREVAHVSCPTCGLTRALVLLAHGEIGASLAIHPWGALLAVQLLGGWAAWGGWLAGRLARRPDRLIPAVVALNAAGLVAFWVVRFLAGTLPAAG